MVMCGYCAFLMLLFISSTPPERKSGNNITRVVIDAGHGGHDSGCLGLHAKEKDVALAIALKLGKFIEDNCKDVKVFYTRKTDKFVGLDERAAIANKNKADLFICIHCNSGAKAAFGIETYVMGLHKTEENLAVAKRENSVVILEKDYKKKYEGGESTDFQEPELQPDAPVQTAADDGSYYQEYEIIRLLLSYADSEITATAIEEETNKEISVSVKVKQFMKHELEFDGVRFDNELFAEIFAAYDDSSENSNIEISYFLHHENADLKNLTAELVSNKYELSAHWGERGIIVMPFDQQLSYGVKSAVYRMKLKFIRKLIKENAEVLQQTAMHDEPAVNDVLVEKKQLDELVQHYNRFFGTVVGN